MPTVKIDDAEYDFDSLPEEARRSLGMLRTVDQEIEHLKVRMAIAQTARIAYGTALKEALAKPVGEILQVTTS